MTTSSDLLRQKLTESLAATQPALTRRDVRLPGIRGKALAVIGVRRGGKTSFLWQCRGDRLADGRPAESQVLVSLEDKRLVGMSVADLGWLLDEHARQFPALREAGTMTVYLDEVQTVPDWERLVRRLMDAGGMEIFACPVLRPGSSAARWRPACAAARWRCWCCRSASARRFATRGPNRSRPGSGSAPPSAPRSISRCAATSPRAASPRPDFLAHRAGESPLLVQACLESEGDETWERELRGLQAGSRAHPEARAFLVTLDAAPPTRPLPSGLTWAPACALAAGGDVKTRHPPHSLPPPSLPARALVRLVRGHRSAAARRTTRRPRPICTVRSRASSGEQAARYPMTTAPRSPRLRRSAMRRKSTPASPRSRLWRTASGVPALLLLLVSASCGEAEKPTTIPPAALARMLDGLQAGAPTATHDEADEWFATASRTDPNWPALTYLVGELRLRHGRVEPARAAFRELASWAASSSADELHGNGWGGSGLATLALWRWLRILDEHGGDPDEVEQALEVAGALQRTRFFAGMVRSGFLPALPLVEEDIARRLAHVSWDARRPEATRLFLDFVSIDSTGDYDATDELLERRMYQSHLAAPERLELFRLRRQLNQVRSTARRQRAADELRLLWADAEAAADVRAEAGYEWSNFYRDSERMKADVIAVLTSSLDLAAANGVLAEKALYRRGMIQNSVQPKDRGAFFADLTALLDRFPGRRLGDDALFQLASEHLLSASPDLDRALTYFERLRTFDGPNDWLDSAYFLPAVGLVDRGAEADLGAADLLLAEYLERFPDGPFRLRCLFWRSRIAERTGDTETARLLFSQVVQEAPYDYYGLRARLHLETGPRAALLPLPEPDSVFRRDLRRAYRQSRPERDLVEATPYHERLRAAERSDLLRRLLPLVGDLGRRFRSRLDQIDLARLDEEHLIPPVALLLSLRQDALAARDAVLTADNRLRLAGFLGARVGDWPLAIIMAHVPNDAPRGQLKELQADPRYLATVYPSAADVGTLQEILTGVAWKIDGSTALSQSLMYAVIRRESGYFPGAISPRGALGLFQVLPRTFEKRESCWALGAEGEKPTPTSYLFDAVRNANFWSCWVRTEFEPRSRDGIALTLLNHHAGAGSLAEWSRAWRGRSLAHDLELQIEMYPFLATRSFVRSALTDLAIVDASGVFEAGRGASGVDEL